MFYMYPMNILNRLFIGYIQIFDRVTNKFCGPVPLFCGNLPAFQGFCPSIVRNFTRIPKNDFPRGDR